MSLTISALAWACAGGFIPALFWLWFWLKEDEHPEPHKLILYSFLGGMAAVPIAGLLQGILKDAFFTESWNINFHFFGTAYVIPSIIILYALWAGIEEVLKLFAAMFTSLTRKEDDEPIDPSIYLLTAALGFACLENILFVIDPINSGNYTLSILTGNVRFVGATLLHLLSSASIGVAVGLVFYKPLWVKGVRTFLGLILATSLHTLFNLLIMRNDPYTTVIAFLGVWILIIALAVFFEKLKNIKQP